MKILIKTMIKTERDNLLILSAATHFKQVGVLWIEPHFLKRTKVSYLIYIFRETPRLWHSLSDAYPLTKQMLQPSNWCFEHQWFVPACRVVRHSMAHHILLERRSPRSYCIDAAGCGYFLTVLHLVNHTWERQGGCHIYTGDTIVFYAAPGRMNTAFSTRLKEPSVLWYMSIYPSKADDHMTGKSNWLFDSCVVKLYSWHCNCVVIIDL